ncbi:hypothetical protein CEXT_268191 [Caerostris extrusa]|uniref:Uncharacterized protein n=1 Tax=Caerostris extrusa TaxID=172846 RepID=A0AAV4W4U3_CAEEX|nr:hypothetical protein CEXT_268191 [Caerostris extrusa]
MIRIPPCENNLFLFGIRYEKRMFYFARADYHVLFRWGGGNLWCTLHTHQSTHCQEEIFRTSAQRSKQSVDCCGLYIHPSAEPRVIVSGGSRLASPNRQ